jgi:hypothetical protein
VLAQFEKATPSASTQEDKNPKRMLVQLDGTNSIVGAEEELDLKKMLPELTQNESPARVQSEGDFNNIATILSDSDRASVLGQSTVCEVADRLDPKQLLAEFGLSTSAKNETTVCDDWHDPRALLAELERRVSFADDDHPMRMLAEFEQKMPTGVVDTNMEDAYWSR